MKTKRFAAIMAAGAVTAAALAGCGSSSTGSTASGSASSAAAETAAAEETSAAAETTASEADAAETAASAETSSDTASSVQGALDGVELAIGTSGTYAPFSYFAEDGTTLQGYDIGMLDALQQILGFTVKDGTYQDMDYGPLGTSLSQGSLDVGAAALCATDERKKNMNFTQTYYDAGIVVCVAEDNDTITSVDDLTSGDYTVALQTGTIAYEYGVANLPESCIQAYDSQALAYKAVEDGQADATIYDLPGTNYAIKTGQIQLKTVGDEFYTGQAPYAIALSFDICEQYPEILDDFNAAIDTLRENGTLDQLNEEWCQ
ncbi:MAG: ABC transporter substrate-binding protein [Lachnospiraceae bacterium]